MTDKILDELVAKGVSGEVIVEVAKLIAAAEVLERQRGNARERMRDVRERRSRTFANVQNGSEPPPAYTTPPREKPKKVSLSRGTRLPADWQPDLDDCAYAVERGLDPPTLTTDFCDYWHARAGPGAVKVDWKATWRRWCRTASERKSSGGQTHGRRHGSVLDALDRLGERLNAEGSFADQYVPGSSGPTPLRLDQDVRPTGFKLVSKG